MFLLKVLFNINSLDSMRDMLNYVKFYLVLSK